jgi:hypothetical protein
MTGGASTTCSSAEATDETPSELVTTEPASKRGLTQRAYATESLIMALPLRVVAVWRPSDTG